MGRIKPKREERKQASLRQGNTYFYCAPLLVVGGFYVVLFAWTVVCAILLGGKALTANWGSFFQWFMIVFVVAYTWYFSAGIFYKVSMDREGNLKFTSLRRVVELGPDDVFMVEGPHLPLGFLRFRLAREKAYLMCSPRNQQVRGLLVRLRQLNPELKFKNVAVEYFRP